MTAGERAYDLERFVTAQEGVFETAMAELRGGAKQSHWMWFVFPQIAGLGRSAMARLYAIGSAAEARAYLAHPVLGERLRQSVAVLCDLEVSDPVAVFGPVDAMKLKSSLTLFERAAAEGSDDEAAFAALIDGWFDGERDGATIAALG